MRQLVLAHSPDRNGRLLLEGGDYRYLVQVLRKAEGDTVEARLPDGCLSTMRIAAVNRKDRTVTLASGNTHEADDPSADPGGSSSLPGVSMPSLPAMPEGFPFIVLFQWLLKGPKMDQVIRQATETGVALIVPIAGSRCLSRDADSVGDGKTGRWDRIVREARQQSGSAVGTRVLSPVPAGAVAGLWSSLSAGQTAAALVLTEAPLARKSLHEYLVHGMGAAALAIGPEGGMTAAELDLLAEAGFVAVHFRTNILRAETAALYGIAAVQSALTESEKWQLKE